MVDLRKVLIIFIIAVLYTVFVNTTIEAVYPMPTYEDFCSGDQYGYSYEKTIPSEQSNRTCAAFTDVTVSERKECSDAKGEIRYEHDAYGCPVSWECNTCNYQMQQANEKYSFNVFLISAFLALVAIAVGLYLPVEQDALNEWIATGFLLGGLFTLFVGTARGFVGIGAYVRPVVIALELVLVIYIAYRKLSDKKGDNRKKEKKRR